MEHVETVRRWLAIAIVAALPAVTGCGGFFPPINTGGGGGATGNQLYVANQTTESIAGYTIGTSTLTAVASSPVKIAYQPLSMAINPANTLLYVGASTGIYVYFINSNGSISAPSTGAQLEVVNAPSLTVSPDGQWLIVLDGTTQVLHVYQINATTGALTAEAGATYSASSGTWQPTRVRVSPNGALIFAALGTAGDVVFTFNTTTGVAASSQTLATGNVATADFDLAIDPTTTYLYIARSGTNGGVAVYSIGSGGTLTAVSGSPFAAGSGTYSIVVNSTGSYVYAANRTDGTISGYTIVGATATAGLTLTPLSGSPYTSGAGVQQIAIDSSGKYLLAAAINGAPDLTMYSFDITTPGKLDAATSVATDTDPAGAAALALTQ
jgi:6-phosphogluconolactonase